MTQTLARRTIDGTAFGRVAVLMGGHSAEREVSRMSGTGVVEALRSRNVDAIAFDPAEHPLHTLLDRGIQRVFIALHGRGGEDGCTQGALEVLGIPYTGSGVLASALCMDKVMTKRIWSTEGLSTPGWQRLESATVSTQQLAAVVERLGIPLIVKPPREGSSIGVSTVRDASALAEAVALAGQYDRDILCEAFIEGEEVTCPIVGTGDDAQALPVVRIQAPQGAYDYENKYFTDVVQYKVPSGLPEAEEREIQRLTLAAYRAAGCRGWGRADLMIRASDRQPFLLEMNTSPGMTSHSLVPMAAAAAGWDYPQLCLEILARATLDGGRS